MVDELFCHDYTKFYDLNERAPPVIQQSRPEQPPRGETPQCQFVYSTTKVRVSGGLVDLGALLQAAEELKQLSYYGGVSLSMFSGAQVQAHKACARTVCTKTGFSGQVVGVRPLN